MLSLAGTQALLELLTPLLYVVGVGAIVIETVVMTRLRMPRDKASRWLGVKCGLLAFGTEGVVFSTVLLGAHTLLYEHRLFDLGFGWQAWVLCFVLNDLMFYVSHRAQHEVRLLWAVHCVHHSARHYDLTTGIRGSALGAFATIPFYLWLPLVGIHPVLFLVADKLFKFYGLAYHTESVDKLGVLDRVLVTPSNHRVHHATNPHYLDRNYGGLFILFDRLLGTFVPEGERPVYGLVKDWRGTGLWDCQVHELRDLWRDVRAAPTWSQRLRHLLGPPGWKPQVATTHSTALEA